MSSDSRGANAMTDDPIGWRIVSIDGMGSVLCEKKNGQRRRYWLRVGTESDLEMIARIREPLRHGLPPTVAEIQRLWELAAGESLDLPAKREEWESA